MVNLIKNIYFYLLLLIFNKIIICIDDCFEYSCLECDSPEYGHCTKCLYGWALKDGTCPCFNSTCAACAIGIKGNNICYLCKNGYALNDNICYCNIANCEQCGINSCLVCKSGYIYNNKSKICEKLKDENKKSCYDENCDICFSELEGACINCKEGFEQKKGKCIELIKVDEKGLCPSDYYSFSDYCYPRCDGVNCVTSYSEHPGNCPSNLCLECENNENLRFKNSCDNSLECSSNEGCVNCITNDECLFCNQGYYLLDGLCHKCIKGCGICRNNQTCEYCLSGFELKYDKKCKLTNNFDFNIELYNKFKEDFRNNTCYNNKSLSFLIKNSECPDCDDESEECSILQDKNCLYNFYYHGKSFCFKCIDGYQINNNHYSGIDQSCTLICSDENCANCFISEGKEICSICKNYLIPNGAKCSSCSNWEGCENCTFIDGNEYCTICKEGYFLKDDNCTRCSDSNSKFCSLYKGEEICTVCNRGFYLNNNFCSECTIENCDYCDFFNGEEICTSCKEGYGLLNSTTCEKCEDENCKYCYIKNGIHFCIKCKEGYKNKNETKCELDCYDEYCTQCVMKDNNRFCEECKQGSRLNEGKCIRCNDPYCLSCPDDEKNCTLCDYYFKLFDGKCASSFYCTYDNQYCKYCINMGICKDCYDNFKLSESGECLRSNDAISIIFCIVFPSVLSFFIFILLILICCYLYGKDKEI